MPRTRPQGPDRRIGASCRPAVGLLVALVLQAAVVPTAAADETAPLRHWAFGWDPVDSGTGLTVRYRFTPRWDLALAAGPNDYRQDSVSARWDDDVIIVEDGVPDHDDFRREQGWVRLATGARFWRHDRLAVSGVLGVTYRWSNEEARRRDFQMRAGSVWDYRNTRDSDDVDTWNVTLGIRPSVMVTSRFQVEFEAGLSFVRSTIHTESEQWWDSSVGTDRQEETRHYRSFQDYGRFDLYELKFIFWF